MSSVNGSDYSATQRKDETIRRNREDYQKKESALIKDHEKEVSRLNQRHYEEMERLKADHEKQLQRVQKQAENTITERDHHYQEQIDHLRAMHHKQLQQLSEEDNRKLNKLKATLKQDEASQKMHNDHRFDELSNDFAQKIRDKDEFYQKELQENRQAQERSLQEEHDKLDAAHQKQLQSVIQDRNEHVANLEGRYNDYRKFAEHRHEQQQLQNLKDHARDSENLVHAVRREREKRAQAEDNLREGFSDGIAQERDRFNKALAERRDAQEEAVSDLKHGIVGRLQHRVDRLSKENTDLKDQNSDNKMHFRKEKRQEIDHIRDAYQKNIQNYKNQRDEAVKQFNERNHADVKKMAEKNQKLLHDANRQYRSDLDLQTRRDKAALKGIQGNLKAQNEESQKLADLRVKNVVAKVEDSKQRMAENQVKNREIMQEEHADEIHQLRTKLEDEKQKAVNSIKEQMRKQGIDYAAKMEYTVQSYERKIQELKDELIKGHRSDEQKLKRTIAELSHSKKISLEQQNAQYQDKMKTLQAQQELEIKRLNRQHEARIDELAGTIRKS